MHLLWTSATEHSPWTGSMTPSIISVNISENCTVSLDQSFGGRPDIRRLARKVVGQDV